MALITCPECGREISSFAEACVHCGFPMSKYKSLTDEIKKNRSFAERFEENQKKTNLDVSSGVTGKEAIKLILEICEETNASLANKLGISQQAIWDRLNNKKNKSLTLARFIEMGRALGYKVIMTPNWADLPEGAFLIMED